MTLTNLAENLGLEEEEFSEIFELYTQTTSCDIIELEAAIDAEDAEKAHEKAHSIKGSSGNLGLNELHKLAGDIDDRARLNSLDGLKNMVQVLQEKFEKLVKELEHNA